MSNKGTTRLNDPYQADEGKAYHEAIHGGLGPYGYSLIATRRAAKLQPHILPSDRVLEYGVGPGWNLARIKAEYRKGMDVATAVRPNVEAQGIEFTAQISKEDLSGYDIVICSHVLEHLPDPNEGLSAIFNCLKPDGKALLYVPCDFVRRFEKYDTAEPNHHLYSWCVQSFGNLLALNGFVILEGRLRPFGYERIVAQWIERLHFPRWAYSFFLQIALLVKPQYEIVFIVAKPSAP